MFTARSEIDKDYLEYGLDVKYLTPDWYNHDMSISYNLRGRINFINEQILLGKSGFRDELWHYHVVTNNMTVLTRRKLGLEARFLPYS